MGGGGRGGASLSEGSGDQRAHATRTGPPGGNDPVASEGQWSGLAGAGGAWPGLGLRAQRPLCGERGLAPPAGGGLLRPQRAARLPLPSPPGERCGEGPAPGAGAAEAPVRGGPGEGRGRGAWLRSALQCGGGNRFQFVLLLAQRALLALGTEHSLPRLEGLPAGLEARCGGATFQGSRGAAPHNPTPWAFLEPSFLSLHHCRSCLPHAHLPSLTPVTSSRKPSPEGIPEPLWSSDLPQGWLPSHQLY